MASRTSSKRNSTTTSCSHSKASTTGSGRPQTRKSSPANLDGAITGAPVIDLVVGAHKTSKAVGPYTLRQLEALDGAIPWRFHVVTDWRTDLQVAPRLPRGRFPIRRSAGNPMQPRVTRTPAGAPHSGATWASWPATDRSTVHPRDS